MRARTLALSANSVHAGGRTLKTNSVSNTKIDDGAVTGAKVLDNSLGLADFSSVVPVQVTAGGVIGPGICGSLNNVVRHADASRCEVGLARLDGHLAISVSDDGRGVGDASGLGHGAESMRRRASDLGGEVVVEPRSPRGTVVRAVLPLGGA